VGRVLLALLLMIGFYVLAFGVIAGLLWIPYAMVAYGHRVYVKPAVFCVIGAFLILKAIVPRPDRFEPPGPRLSAERHPRLFAALQALANASGEPLPAEVYLVGDVNAWVARRGGVMGFGSRPVMGLGLPLLQMLTVSQMKAVLAHEFGHFCGGDTRLGPWIYKTRGAIGRTLQDLASHSSTLQLPFKAYGSLFLRVTHAVSRRQELGADALAARTVGARPLIEGLRATHAAALGFPAYWQGEVTPVLQAGFLPPLATGFARFAGQASVATALAREVDEEIVKGSGSPYDSHPPLKDRIAAISKLASPPPPTDDALAVTLLEGLGDLERRLLASGAGADNVRKLKPLAWDRVGAEVYVPRWRGLAGENAGALAGWTTDNLADKLKGIEELGFRVVKGKAASPEQRRKLAEATVGAALVVGLVGSGWQVDAGPGGPVTAHKGGLRLEPFGTVARLGKGEITADAWRDQCSAAGIGGLALGPPA
jgi:Zn-dependent protease with chaperone function